MNIVVTFNPKLTEVIFFDLEFYVPPSDRRRNGASLLSNPFRKDHFLLGGVFSRTFPLQSNNLDRQMPPMESFWIWQAGTEVNVLKSIFAFFQDSWKPLQNKSPSQADLIAVGTGISRFDLPALFSRSLLHDIAPRDSLFASFFHLKIVDLSEVGILLPPQGPILYPRSTNELTNFCGLSKQKSPGTRVWEMYDAGDYSSIEKRTTEEVQDIIRIYNAFINRMP